ncbi:MAG: hypothetical protein JXX29_09955 [Deltaproteobacteria bacterium]|nr:hypothetical protein [Deltaproteobacteria bacterium]MBN2671989.1 hypothetical protein [Deltaproteobacteria bacterium]
MKHVAITVLCIWAVGCAEESKPASLSELSEEFCDIYQQCWPDEFDSAFADFAACVSLRESTITERTDGLESGGQEACVDLYYDFLDCQNQFLQNSGCNVTEDSLYAACERTQNALATCLESGGQK